MKQKKTLALVTFTALTSALTGCSSSPVAPAAANSSSSTTSTASTSTASTSTASTPTTTPAKEDPVDAAFKTKVEALCTAWVADGIKHQPPFYVGNPLAITREQLPQAGAYLDTLAVNHELAKSTSDVGEPNAGKASWAILRADFDAFQKHEEAAITAAKTADLAAWTEQATAAETARDAILNDLSNAGFHKGACRDQFERSAYHG